MSVAVRVNGEKTLRLVVDTGATRILLSRSAARKAGLRPRGPVRLYGIGSRADAASYAARVESIRVGELELRDLEIDVLDQAFPPGVDGLLGPSVFAGYIVRLDSPRRRLDLLPAAGPPAGKARGPHVLVDTEVKGIGRGRFLVDTGSGFSAVDEELAARLDGPRFTVTGIGGLAWVRDLGPLEFLVSGRTLRDRKTFAMNLSELSRRSGHRIAGLIGFSALRHSVITIDYRSGEVMIEPGR